MTHKLHFAEVNIEALSKQRRDGTFENFSYSPGKNMLTALLKPKATLLPLNGWLKEKLELGNTLRNNSVHLTIKAEKECNGH